MPQKIARGNDDELMDLGGPHFQKSSDHVIHPRFSGHVSKDFEKSGQLALIITSHVVKPISKPIPNSTRNR